MPQAVGGLCPLEYVVRMRRGRRRIAVIQAAERDVRPRHVHPTLPWWRHTSHLWVCSEVRGMRGGVVQRTDA